MSIRLDERVAKIAFDAMADKISHLHCVLGRLSDMNSSKGKTIQKLNQKLNQLSKEKP